MYRHVQSSGLTNQYRNEEYFHDRVRYLVGLSFVKPNEVTTHFDTLFQGIKDDVELKSVYKYFDKTYGGATYFV